MSEQSTPAETLSRPLVPALDAILGKRLDVLDDGFVRVVDYMGTDASIVQAARVSYGAGTTKVSDDRALIRYLMRHQHTTPFEMCELKLHVRVPMDCWRQWIRHRTASVNEYSTRYSVAIDRAQMTDASEWRTQSTQNRQGSASPIEDELGDRLTAGERELHDLARKVYNDRIESGVAREQARKDLPLSTYTEAYWKTNLHNLFHFLRLRMDDHAQDEIRAYATTIGKQIVSQWCPLAWEAFVDYQVDGVFLSSLDLRIVPLLSQGKLAEATAALRESGHLPKDPADAPKRNRERAELEAKLKTLALPIPWLKAD